MRRAGRGPGAASAAQPFLRGAWGMWLDDANTLTLPAYVRFDGKVSYAIDGIRIGLSGRNLLDAQYSTTGYPDPAGSGTTYYYPAAGRTLTLSVTAAW